MSNEDNITGNETNDDWEQALADQASASTTKNGAPDSASLEKAELESLKAEVAQVDESGNLDAILDIPVSLSVEIGQSRISIRNLLQLNQGSVVELDRLAGEPLDVMVNNTLVAHGEVVVINEKYGIRLTDVISAHDRVKQL